MSVTTRTIKNWIKMTNVKNCNKIIDGTKCPCADKLRRLYVTKPLAPHHYDIIKEKTEIQRQMYTKCFYK